MVIKVNEVSNVISNTLFTVTYYVRGFFSGVDPFMPFQIISMSSFMSFQITNKRGIVSLLFGCDPVLQGTIFRPCTKVSFVSMLFMNWA